MSSKASLGVTPTPGRDAEGPMQTPKQMSAAEARIRDRVPRRGESRRTASSWKDGGTGRAASPTLAPALQGWGLNHIVPLGTGAGPFHLPGWLSP